MPNKDKTMYDVTSVTTRIRIENRKDMKRLTRTVAPQAAQRQGPTSSPDTDMLLCEQFGQMRCMNQ
jgi:hypothetical protein